MRKLIIGFVGSETNLPRRPAGKAGLLKKICWVVLLVGIVSLGIGAEGKGCGPWREREANYEIELSSGSSGVSSHALSTPSDLNIQVSTKSQFGQINLSWIDNSDNEWGFEIQRKTNEEDTYSRLALLGANVSSYADTGSQGEPFSPSVAYYYRMRAFDAYYNWSPYIYSYPPGIMTLSPPSNVAVKNISATQVKILWNDNTDNEAGFKIERKTGINGIYGVVATVEANVTSHTDTSLDTNTTYYYRVRVYHTLSDGGSSDEVRVSTTPPSIWTVTSATNAPTERKYHTAVWTGSKMIVWGGYDGLSRLNTGGIYDPINNAWTPMATTNAPSDRMYHTAIWTGSKMIVWGGYDGSFRLNTGGVYDPANNTWTNIAITNSPSRRMYHTAIWTGSPSEGGTGKMIVWGGYGGSSQLNSGSVYDLANNTWTPIATTDAPIGRMFHTAIWTGSPAEGETGKMIVWGGYDGSSQANTGGIYDPSSNSWTTMATTNAPSGRMYHTAIWTGSPDEGGTGKMIVWGGEAGPDFLKSGGIYEPSSNTWTATTTTNAPTARESHTAVWTGSKMIVWGGFPYIPSGGFYDPATNTWTTTTITNAPSSRESHTAIWTASEMIIWGGYNGPYLNTGAVYTQEE